MGRYYKNKNEVLDELWHICLEDSGSSYRERVFAYALAYLISEIVPQDRTSKKVFGYQQKEEKGT